MLNLFGSLPSAVVSGGLCNDVKVSNDPPAPASLVLSRTRVSNVGTSNGRPVSLNTAAALKKNVEGHACPDSRSHADAKSCPDNMSLPDGKSNPDEQPHLDRKSNADAKSHPDNTLFPDGKSNPDGQPHLDRKLCPDGKRTLMESRTLMKSRTPGRNRARQP